MTTRKQKLELTWIGKEVRPKLEPRILLEDPARSHVAGVRVNDKDIFDNRLIFGDNLLALKALEAEFTGKVKCVYIDPPYNTGSAFAHYDDGVEHSLWLSPIPEADMKRQPEGPTAGRLAVHFRSTTDLWETPWPFYRRLDREFSFTLDVCAVSQNAKCERYFSPIEDGLSQPWDGTCWMNPPYGRGIGQWVAKALTESRRGAVVVALVPARTDTRWWHDGVMAASEIRFVCGRIRFGSAVHAAPFPSAVVVFRNKRSTERPYLSTYSAV